MTTQRPATSDPASSPPCTDVDVVHVNIDRLDRLLNLVGGLDHGIETAATRREAGKPRQGKVTLSAGHEGNHLVIDLQVAHPPQTDTSRITTPPLGGSNA